MLFSRPGKEPLGGCNVTPFAQEKVDGAARFIHDAIEVDPLAFDLEVSLIHAPRVADWPCVPAPALLKLGDILLHPPKNSRMGQSDTTFRHHLDEVTEAQFKCDVPSHTQNDDLLVKVPSLERILCRGRFRHPGSYRRIPSLSTVCTRTFLEVTDNGSGIADSQVASREGLGFSNMRARARKYRRTTKRSHCVGSRY